MDVRNCRMCGKLYNFIGGPYRNLCPNCIEKMEKKFDEVKEYIEEHKAATINEVSEECDVSSRQIEQWIREERLMISDDSPIGIRCERCGATIRSGRFCERCKNKIANNLGSMYGESNAAVESMEKRASAEAKMRFLDKDNK
jgi:flagellar operon protein (TIGR03826 family)